MDIAKARVSGPSTPAGEASGKGPTPPATPDLSRLLRWEETGGGWRVAGVGAGSVTLSLVTCDGGEEMEVLTSTDPAVLGHVAGRARYP